MNIKAAIRQRLHGFGQAFRRFPVAIGLAAGLFVWLIINEYRMDQILGQVWVGRLILSWIYAIFLAFLIGSLTEGKRIALPWLGLIYGLGAAIVLGVYFWVFPSDQQLFVKDGIYVYLGLCLATLLAIFLETRLRPGQRVPHKALEVLISFAWTGLFSFVIGVGTFMVFVMINALFNANLRLDRFARVIFEATMLLFAVPFFLSGLQPSGETKEDQYEVLFQRLLRYVCLPLAFVYTAVLYVYSAKILITQTWPQGLVSHLVLWYSLFVITVYIFLRGDKAKLPKWFNYFPMAVVPLLGMMFGSIGQRIAQYGWTPNRYLVVIAGIWALGALIYLSLKKYSPWCLVASLVLFILIGTNSPIGAYDMSVRSQTAILHQTLTDNNMLVDDTVVKADVPKEVKQQVSASVQWFVNQQATDKLSFLPDNFSLDQFENVFGFAPTYRDNWDNYRQYVGFYATPEISIPTQAGKLIRINLYNTQEKSLDGYSFKLDGEALVITPDNQSPIRVSMSWLIEQEESKEVAMPKMIPVGEYTLYIDQAGGVIEQEVFTISDLTFMLYVPEK